MIFLFFIPIALADDEYFDFSFLSELPKPNYYGYDESAIKSEYFSGKEECGNYKRFNGHWERNKFGQLIFIIDSEYLEFYCVSDKYGRL